MKSSGKGKDKERTAGGEVEETPAKVGHEPPEELMDFMPTAAEGTLATWIENAGSDFLGKVEDEGRGRTVPVTVVSDEDGKKRLRLMKAIDDSGITKMLDGHLATYVNNQLLLQLEEDPNARLDSHAVVEALEKARDLGPPTLSAAADQVLTEGAAGKVGYSQDLATLTPMTWNQGVGKGEFRYLGARWSVYDYGDELPISEGLVDMLDLDDIQCQKEEIRQCLYLHCTASYLLAKHGRIPSKEEVKEATKEVRLEAVWQAREAAYHLGACPAEVGKAEADVRVFAHDILHLDHDKDYRCLAAFPPSVFEGCTLHMVRMDPHGAVTTEIIRNPGGPGKSQWELWLLVSKCHMRVLNKPPGAITPKAVREVEAAGWEVHLEAVAGPEACVRARDLARCPRCDEAAGEPLRIGDGSRGPSVLGLYPLPHPDQKIGGWVPGPLEVRDLPDDHRFTDEDIKAWLGEQAHLFTRGLAEGVDLIEVYAGNGRLSDEILARGGIALKLGLDHGQDFRLARDRALARALFKRLKPAHAWFAWPCTPFCAWMKLAVLRNCDVAPRLREGRVHLRFSIQLAREQRLAKRHSHCENPLTSTAWREPQATHEFADPSWHRTRLDQCTTGLVGPQGDLHLKPTLIRTTHPDVHNALSLRCPADHPHELVQGPATAAMYSPRLAHLVADIVCRPRTHSKIGGGRSHFRSFSQATIQG